MQLTTLTQRLSPTQQNLAHYYLGEDQVRIVREGEASHADVARTLVECLGSWSDWTEARTREALVEILDNWALAFAKAPRAGCRREADGRWSVWFGEAGTRFSGLTRSSAEAIVARFCAPGADPQRVEFDVRHELDQTELPEILKDARLRAELAIALVEARARVATAEQWIRGNYLRSAGKGKPTAYCVLGACGHTSVVVAAGALALQGLLCAGLPPRARSLSAWNDAPERTHADILALFDRAIEFIMRAAEE